MLSVLINLFWQSIRQIEDKFAPQEYGVVTKKGSGFSKVCEDLVTKWLDDGTIQGLIDNYGLN